MKHLTAAIAALLAFVPLTAEAQPRFDLRLALSGMPSPTPVSITACIDASGICLLGTA